MPTGDYALCRSILLAVFLASVALCREIGSPLDLASAWPDARLLLALAALCGRLGHVMPRLQRPLALTQDCCLSVAQVWVLGMTFVLLVRLAACACVPCLSGSLRLICSSMPALQPSPVDIVLVHSSDLHVDDEATGTKHGGGTSGLAAVLAAARSHNADIVLLAGDTFDNNRVSAPVVERAGRLIAEAAIPVVILPGNHDPALANSVFHRGRYTEIPTISIFGITHEEAATFPEHDLEIWGHAHRDYENMAPLRGPRDRSTRWQIAMAHGHYEPPHSLATPLRPSWLFSDEHIAETRADYLALGHWDRPARVGDGTVPAYYSGSPDLAQTVNVIRLTQAGEVLVSREPLRWDHP